MRSKSSTAVRFLDVRHPAAAGGSAKPAPGCCVGIEHPDVRRPAAVASNRRVAIGCASPDDEDKIGISVDITLVDGGASCVETEFCDENAVGKEAVVCNDAAVVEEMLGGAEVDLVDDELPGCCQLITGSIDAALPLPKWCDGTGAGATGICRSEPLLPALWLAAPAIAP